MKEMFNSVDLYTLAEKMEGSASILNGKIFHVSIDDLNQITFIEHGSLKVLRQTTPVEDLDKNLYGWTLTTKSGSVYKLYDVLMVIPTSVSGYNTKSDFDRNYEEVSRRIDESRMKIQRDIEEFEKNKEETLSRMEKRHEEFHRQLEEATENINKGVSNNQKALEEIDNMLDELDDTPKKTLDDFPRVIEENHISKPIYPGDGYYGVEYTFEESISKEDFIEFCNLKGHDMSKLTGYSWWENHASIENRDDNIYVGSHNTKGTRWTYKMIKPSTD